MMSVVATIFERIMNITLSNFKFNKNTITALRRELQAAEKLNNVRLYKIVWALLMINAGKSATQIAETLHVSARTIYDWFDRFVVEKYAWLRSFHFPGRGRKPKLTKKQKKQLYDMIVAGPEANGFECGGWNCAMIAELIQRRFKVIFSPRYLCTFLKSMGITYQKAKFVTDKIDNEQHCAKRLAWKRNTWPKILRDARKNGGVILFGDEVSFAQWGSLGRTWAPIGQQPCIKTSGKRKGLKMFGVIEFFSGDFIYPQCEGKFNGEAYIQFLKQVLETYKGCCRIIMFIFRDLLASCRNATHIDFVPKLIPAPFRLN